MNKFSNQVEECPIIIGGKEYKTDQVKYQVMVRLRTLTNPKYDIHMIFQQPHDHQKKIAKFYWATPELINQAIETSLKVIQNGFLLELFLQ